MDAHAWLVLTLAWGLLLGIGLIGGELSRQRRLPVVEPARESSVARANTAAGAVGAGDLPTGDRRHERARHRRGGPLRRA